MRLTALRLAGFKSFVEPTELRFPSELVGIVGPNGCGKSNTLDALRWVMGESAARQLRGQSLEDVIFAGSAQRRPVAQASVELVFDNSAGLLQGPWAGLHEISIRRVLGRDGQSRYFLNGTPCRRKDIADLFLGTGLGSRSYAIIEQGQIARLIEARPEELRAMLEEAAGISRYKARRRETEDAIRQTRENLARLADLGEELRRQLERLERQARAAERLRALQAQEGRLELALHALELRRLEHELAREEGRLAAEEAGLLAAQADAQQAEAGLAQARAQEAAAQEGMQRAQAEAYAAGAETARLSQELRHARELGARMARERAALEQEMALLAQTENDIVTQLAHLDHELGLARQRVEALEAACDEAQKRLHAAQAQAQDARLEFEAVRAQAQEPAQQLRLERTRLEHAEREQRALLARRARLCIPRLEGEVQEIEAELAEARAAQEGLGEDIEAMEGAQAGLAAQLDEARRALAAAEEAELALRREEAGMAAERRALHALAQSSRDDEPPALRAWLQRHGLHDMHAAARLRPDPRWAAALDAVLGEALRAVPVDSLDAWQEQAIDATARGLWLIEPAPAGQAQGSGILQGEYAAALLGGLRPMESLSEALARRHELGPGEAWLTPEGEWITRHAWRRPPSAEEGAGALSRSLRLSALEAALAELQPRLAEAHAHALQAGARVQELERQQAAHQAKLRAALRAQGEAATRVERLRLRLEQAQGRLHGQRREEDELAAQLGRLEEELMAHRERLELLARAQEDGETRLMQADAARERAGLALARANEASRAAERELQEARAKVQMHARERELRAQQLTQQRDQGGRLAQRLAELAQRMQEAEAPLPALSAGHEAAQRREAEAQEALARARTQLDHAQQSVRQAQEAQLHAGHALEEARGALEAGRLRVQALHLKAEAPRTALAQAGEEAMTQALQSLAGLDGAGCAARLAETRTQIARLGAVNLAALEEFTEARERKARLDAQQADLSEALATLEAAIARMDRETRGRFRATFEAVNAQLGELFQRLFSGGEAYLSLTDDDWLEAGVVLMARPPGKKVSRIQLLSGGEKSLTALALVFAIFQLNPAPFCLLDEVDAPLDEANVTRFCAMVREMAARVQFIFITHNKTTMEMAHQLIGVTMREPGVSRIVAVDLDEAERLVKTQIRP